MKAIERVPHPYVVEEDRALPIEEQTVFWIIPKTHREANLTIKRYGESSKDTRKGYRELNANKLDIADIEEWRTIIDRIENFAFTDVFYKEHPEVAKMANDKGYVKEIDKQWLIEEVIKYLPVDVVNEIFEVANDYSRLTEVEKKD